jgi:hypothetical protein
LKPDTEEMTDATKWKSIMIRVEDYELLKDVASFRKQSMAAVLTDLIEAQWDKNFPPPLPLPEAPRDRPRNPFLTPNLKVDR